MLQRWVQACGGRGAFPIKFNGSIFSVEPKFTGGQPFDADWRRWGDCFWWQNTRLPYYPMLAQGDWVVAMYHDQGLTALKYASFGKGINVTLGLPIIRTSVEHGTALELAGTGRADPGSLFVAVEQAIEMSRLARHSSLRQG